MSALYTSVKAQSMIRLTREWRLILLSCKLKILCLFTIEPPLCRSVLQHTPTLLQVLKTHFIGFLLHRLSYKPFRPTTNAKFWWYFLTVWNKTEKRRFWCFLILSKTAAGNSEVTEKSPLPKSSENFRWENNLMDYSPVIKSKTRTDF